MHVRGRSSEGAQPAQATRGDAVVPRPANPYRTLEVRADVELTDDDDQRSMTRKVISSYGVDPETMPAALTEERTIVTFRPRRVVTMG